MATNDYPYFNLRLTGGELKLRYYGELKPARWGAVVLEGQRCVRGVVRVFLAPENAPNPPPALAFEYSL